MSVNERNSIRNNLLTVHIFVRGIIVKVGGDVNNTMGCFPRLLLSNYQFKRVWKTCGKLIPFMFIFLT